MEIWCHLWLFWVRLKILERNIEKGTKRLCDLWVCVAGFHMHKPRTTCSISTSQDIFQTVNDINIFPNISQALYTFLRVERPNLHPHGMQCTVEFMSCSTCGSTIEIGNSLHTEINFVVSLFPQYHSHNVRRQTINVANFFPCTNKFIG